MICPELAIETSGRRVQSPMRLCRLKPADSVSTSGAYGASRTLGFRFSGWFTELCSSLARCGRSAGLDGVRFASPRFEPVSLEFCPDSDPVHACTRTGSRLFVEKSAFYATLSVVSRHRTKRDSVLADDTALPEPLHSALRLALRATSALFGPAADKAANLIYLLPFRSERLRRHAPSPLRGRGRGAHRGAQSTATRADASLRIGCPNESPLASHSGLRKLCGRPSVCLEQTEPPHSHGHTGIPALPLRPRRQSRLGRGGGRTSGKTRDRAGEHTLLPSVPMAVSGQCGKGIGLRHWQVNACRFRPPPFWVAPLAPGFSPRW